MMLFFVWLSIFLCPSTQMLISAANDRLLPGESISVNQTIVSDGDTFAFGFFATGNSSTGGGSTSSNRYVGIWYNNIPDKNRKTVVWVANRENPLRDSGGILKIAGDGNLVLLDADGSVLWSTNITNSTAAAVLLDSGNFVLEDGGGNYIWQSFDHPSETGLPNMKLRSSWKTGVVTSLTSWKDSQDPSRGNYTLMIDPRTLQQLLVMRGPEIYWRSGIWSGQSLTGARETNTSSLYILNVEIAGDEFRMYFRATGRSGEARYVMEHTGLLKLLFLPENSNDWTTMTTTPSGPCDVYKHCGPSGLCDDRSSPICKCLRGFVPKNQRNWDAGDYSSGCVRRVATSRDKQDRFLVAERVKLPDHWKRIGAVNATVCEEICLSNPNCTAYAYPKAFGGWISSRCLLWEGELLDLKQNQPLLDDGGQDLNIRLSASELVDVSQINGHVDKGKRLLLVIVPSVAAVILLFGLFGLYFRRRLQKKGKQRMSSAVIFDDFKVPHKIENGKGTEDSSMLDFDSVLAATNNFSTENKLGEGGFGPVYKGELQGQEVAIKRLSKSSGQGFEEFKNEVKLISRLQHMNVVRLIGWCTRKDEKMLIYEYLPNKSLDKFIFDPTRSEELGWERRFRIIEGINQGLLYLHRYSRFRIIHRDLKTSNILLDGEMNPKISDFGLARIFGGNQTEANTNRVVGTYGYMSPEYALDGVFSEKSDVFSFGVILLEIVTGKRSTGFYPYKKSLNLLGYAWQFWEEGKGLELLDLSIGSEFSAPEVMKCIQVGLLCVQENVADRPTVSSVMSMLSSENAVLPNPKQPAFAIG